MYQHKKRNNINKVINEGVKRAGNVSNVKVTKEVIKSGTAASAAVSAATGLSVAATSGAGITSGLAAAGSVVGGGMAAGPAVLAVGPAYAGAKIFNETLFKDNNKLSSKERDARSAARIATKVGAAAGVGGAATITVAGGASGAAIMSTLAGIGGAVGGGAIAGTAIVAASPVVAAGAIGYGIYKLFGGK
ncbi:RNA polymerase subunit sigma-24 [Cyanothece sp. BG0011]|uniref:RNA polymerase subunit sigma-24 n=1 Tax=Cyanothece sp. BG0011 TaxID=2082950 RepID=UPI0018E4EB97|nr:RNA polymerase subunit sigma-24 [Cyanothece sp. BG0011]